MLPQNLSGFLIIYQRRSKFPMLILDPSKTHLSCFPAWAAKRPLKGLQFCIGQICIWPLDWLSLIQKNSPGSFELTVWQRMTLNFCLPASSTVLGPTLVLCSTGVQTQGLVYARQACDILRPVSGFYCSSYTLVPCLQDALLFKIRLL